MFFTSNICLNFESLAIIANQNNPFTRTKSIKHDKKHHPAAFNIEKKGEMHEPTGKWYIASRKQGAPTVIENLHASH